MISDVIREYRGDLNDVVFEAFAFFFLTSSVLDVENTDEISSPASE